MILPYVPYYRNVEGKSSQTCVPYYRSVEGKSCWIHVHRLGEGKVK